MPVEIKHYIDAQHGFREVSDSKLGFGLFLHDWKWVSLPDFSNASDLEKLQWVLKEMGVNYPSIDSNDKKKIVLTPYFLFDSSGKLIK